MAVPTEAESVALDEAGPLIRFAAEQLKDLDPNLTLAIATALEAAKSNNWTPQVSQSFWAAFNKLCLFIQPTSMDCLAASHADIEVFSLRNFSRTKVSLAERSSTRYLLALIILIAITIPLQLYVWVGTIASKRTDEILDRLQKSAAQLMDDRAKVIASAKPADATGKEVAQTMEWTAQAEKVTDASWEMVVDLDRLRSETAILQRLTTGRVNLPAAAPRPTDRAFDLNYQYAMNRYDGARLAAANAEESVSLFIGPCVAFILPLLFGIIGAIAYIVRSISDQIKASTFSSTSPIRHLMRATLGALAGVVVGLFSNLSSQFSLSPLALAFLAGYGVEPLFSMFDGVIARFKQS